MTTACTTMDFTRNPRRLFLHPDAPADQSWIYQVAQPFQIAPRQAALLAHIRLGSTRVIDLEVGTDAVIFDSLATLSAQRRFPLARFVRLRHPRNGQELVMVSCTQIGFVPLGARRADGSPHPHAGTGFAVNFEMGYPTALSEQEDTHIDLSSDVYTRIALKQLRYDGRELRVTHEEYLPEDGLIPGVVTTSGPMAPCVSSGDGLIGGMCLDKWSAQSAAAVRWEVDARGHWRPQQPIRLLDYATEPTMVRDVDGSLLLAVRPHPVKGCDDWLALRIFRSTDEGASWQLHLHIPRFLMANAPVFLNRAANGAPFVMTNRHRVPVVHRLAKREMIWAWPLTPDRRGVGEPVLVRDGQEFGPTPTPGSVYRMDHPTATTVQLADGNWHCLVGYRVLEDAEMRSDAGPTPHTGLYVEEVLTPGTPTPTWNF